MWKTTRLRGRLSWRVVWLAALEESSSWTSLVLPLSFKNLSGTTGAFVYSSRKHDAMRRERGGARRNGRETKEDFIFGGPMTLKGASVEEEEERPVEHRA